MVPKEQVTAVEAVDRVVFPEGQVRGRGDPHRPDPLMEHQCVFILAPTIDSAKKTLGTARAWHQRRAGPRMRRPR